MKLLVDARTGWGHGIGRVIASTLPRLARLRPDWRIDALVPPAHAAAARQTFAGEPNLDLVECPIAPFSLAEQTGLQHYARDRDLTWFTNYWVPLAWRTPFAASVYDMLHLLPQYVPASLPKRMAARCTYAKLRREARQIMFCSRFTEREFTRLVGRPRHRGTVIDLGGDHLDYSDRRPLAGRSRRLLAVAASKTHKNFATLFEAWRRAKVPEHWRLTIVSPHEMLLNSIDLATLAGADGRIEIRRGISNAELAALYTDSAVLLMPSLYEGFGLPLIEGMLAGALCVSSNAGALTEVAQGCFALFVNGEDRAGWTAAIERACAMIDREEPELEPLLRHNAGMARRFRWDRTAQEVAEALELAA